MTFFRFQQPLDRYRSRLNLYNSPFWGLSSATFHIGKTKCLALYARKTHDVSEAFVPEKHRLRESRAVFYLRTYCSFKERKYSRALTDCTPKKDEVRNSYEPKTNLLLKVSKRIEPYWRLSRLHAPTATWMLFWPCGWSIMMATVPSAAALAHSFVLVGYCGIGAVLARSFGCIVNDLWDIDLDRQVSRTKNRPLASGELSKPQAFALMFAQFIVALLILMQFNWFTIVLGLSSLGLVAAYPLMKKITHFPQLVLGMTFNWGVLLGWTAVTNAFGPLWLAPMCLYLGGICWTLVYDTIYAHQDKLDDRKVGIKSTAVLWGDNTRFWISLFASGMIGMLAASGITAQLHWPYYAAVGCTGAQLYQQISQTNLDDPHSCKATFESNKYIGAFVFAGIVGSKLIDYNQHCKGDYIVASHETQGALPTDSYK